MRYAYHTASQHHTLPKHTTHNTTPHCARLRNITTAPHNAILYYAALCTPHYASQCSTPQHRTTQHHTVMLHCTIHTTSLHNAVHRDTAPHNTIQLCTLHYAHHTASQCRTPPRYTVPSQYTTQGYIMPHHKPHDTTPQQQRRIRLRSANHTTPQQHTKLCKTTSHLNSTGSCVTQTTPHRNSTQSCVTQTTPHLNSTQSYVTQTKPHLSSTQTA